MYRYHFDCYVIGKDSPRIEFVVEGEQQVRDNCVKIHNALLCSQKIGISHAEIVEIG